MTGVASYYAESLSGRPTASGEPYRPGAFTCAHRRLSFGTRIRVTVLDTGRSAVCRVNDRGPFVRGRIVDVSGAMAEELGLTRRGIARVEIEVVD
jgi:rare lipoprotein A